MCLRRCFLYLVNYGRVKPDMALKALPFLTNVGETNYFIITWF